MIDQSIFLLVLLFGLLIISLIILIKVFIEEWKKKTNGLFIFLAIIGIILILLIPLILGTIQEMI